MTTATLTLHQQVQRYLDTHATKYQGLYVLKGGKYINLRHKSEATYYRKGRQYEFGIPKVHWDRYVKLARESKTVCSIVVEENTSTVYGANIKDLVSSVRVYHGDAVDVGGTVF